LLTCCCAPQTPPQELCCPFKQMSVILLPPLLSLSLSPRRCNLTSRQSFCTSPTYICLGLHTSLSTLSFIFKAFLATAVPCIQSTFFQYPLPSGCCVRISFRCCPILIPLTPRTVRPDGLTAYSGASNRTDNLTFRVPW